MTAGRLCKARDRGFGCWRGEDALGENFCLTSEARLNASSPKQVRALARTTSCLPNPTLAYTFFESKFSDSAPFAGCRKLQRRVQSDRQRVDLSTVPVVRSTCFQLSLAAIHLIA
jgi:hypothetical protein